MANIGPFIGLAREATILDINPQQGTMRVRVNLAKTDINIKNDINIKIPFSWTGPEGEFSGGFPVQGATLWVTQGDGGTWAPLPYSLSDDSSIDRNTSAFSTYRHALMRSFRPGRWVTQVRNNIHLFVDPDDGIVAGSPENSLNIDPNRNIISANFSQQYSFTESSHSVKGVVKRDLRANSNRNIVSSALTSNAYDDGLSAIGLDPLVNPGTPIYRNPTFIENRETVYEFAKSFNYLNDEIESKIYDTGDIPEISENFQRRDSRANCLSLSNLFPNELIETIKGTVVDIYGNILDLNRSILPNGSIDSLSLRSTDVNQSDAFIALREQTRKSIAYHMEINARKDNLLSLDDVSDYSRNRSNFFIDIDKEGQFKINVPSSSETGNIPLLTRYENFSTVEGIAEESPGDFIRNPEDHRDVLIESFGVQSIGLSSGEEELEGFASPVDRITGEPIKLGTAYHDINKTVELHQRNDLLTSYFTSSKLESVPLIEDIVSKNIIVSGPDANAGGRSGTISLDGFLSLNIGANTVDRQSLWWDLAGGVVANIGRDRNNISYAATLDGDVLVQIGAATIADDSRFENLNNAVRAGALDIRVLGGSSDGAAGTMTIIRVDSSGVRIATPGECDIVSMQTMRFKSIRGDMHFDAESIYMYSSDLGVGRLVLRKPGQSI